MMNPVAIMQNLEHGNMLTGPNMRPAIGHGPMSPPQQQPLSITGGQMKPSSSHSSGS